MPAPVSITAPNSPKKRGGKTSYGGSRPSPSGGHTAPAQSAPTVTTVTPSGTVTSSGPAAYAATRATKQARRQSRHVQTALKMVERDVRRRKLQALPPKILQTVKQVNPSASVKDARGLAKMVNTTPNARITSVLGKPTLGTPTVKSVVAQPAKLNTKGPVSTPQVRRVEKKLKTVEAKVQKSSGGVTGDFTPGQTTFINTLSKKSGLSPKVVGAWVAAEAGFGNGGSAAQNEARGYHNWLNIGPFSTDPRLNNPKTAAGYVNEMIHGQGSGANIASISRAAGKPVAQQVSAIANSGWVDGVGNGSPGSVTYGNSIRSLLPSVGEKAGDPKARKHLAVVKAQAKALGVGVDAARNPKSAKTVLVRADGAGMVKWAKAVVGTGEGTKLANKWAQESGLPDSVGNAHPWCAAFIAAGLRRRGITPPSNGAFVGNYLPSVWGKGKIVTTPKPGDLILYGSSHIALYIGGGKQISGNESDAVTLNSVESGATYVRPPYTGKKVPVKVSDAQMVPPSIGGSPAVGGALPGVAGSTLASASSSPASHKPTGAEILAKLKKYGVGTTAPTTSTSSATLAELEKRYGAPTV